MTDASDDPLSGDELRRWLDDAAVGPAAVDAPPRRRRRPLWLAALAAPWVVLAVVLLATSPPTSTDGDTVADPPRAGARDGNGAGPSEPRHVAPPDASRTAPPDASRTAPPDASRTARPDASRTAPPDAAPIAVALVRDAVTTAAGSVTTALDSATPEAPRHLAAGTWLVRVHAVVLRGDRRRWRSARHEVWAAPVGRRDGAVVGLDRPWRVAVGEPGTAPRRWRRSDGDLEAVRGALRAAGLPSGPGLHLERDRAVPGVVRAVTGRAAAWVRVDGRPQVLGTHAP